MFSKLTKENLLHVAGSSAALSTQEGDLRTYRILIELQTEREKNDYELMCDVRDCTRCLSICRKKLM